MCVQATVCWNNIVLLGSSLRLRLKKESRGLQTIISRFDRESDEDEGLEYKDILRSNHVCHARPPRLLALEHIAMRRRHMCPHTTCAHTEIVWRQDQTRSK